MNIYNPNDFDLIIGVETDYSGYTLTKNAWTTITLTSANFKADGTLKITLGNSDDNKNVIPGKTVAGVVFYIDFTMA